MKSKGAKSIIAGLGASLMGQGSPQTVDPSATTSGPMGLINNITKRQTANRTTRVNQNASGIQDYTQNGLDGAQGAVNPVDTFSQGMMMKSPLKAMPGAYESGGLNEDGVDPSIISDDTSEVIAEGLDSIQTNINNAQTVENNNSDDSGFSEAKKERIKGRNDRKSVRQTARSLRLAKKNEGKLAKTKARQEEKNKDAGIFSTNTQRGGL